MSAEFVDDFPTKESFDVVVKKPVDDIIFFGRKFTAETEDALTTATLSLTYDQVSQIEFVFADKNFEELSKGIYEPGIPCRYGDRYMMEVGAVDVAGDSGVPTLTVRCRPRVVRRLKNRRGHKVMKHASPTEFVRSECKAVGADFVGQDSAKRKQVMRDVKKDKSQVEPPSSWTTFQRLAGECGFVLFEANNTIYFGKPSWFLDQFKDHPLQVNYGKGDPVTRTLGIPRCTRSEDTKDKEVTIDFEMEWNQHTRKFRPGRAVKFEGVPTYNGYYLIKSVTVSMIRPKSVVVQVGTPVDPEKIARPVSHKRGGGSADLTVKVDGGGDGSATGQKSAGAFVTNALRQAGKAYVFGAEASPSDASPSAFDCSELVEWASRRAGVYIPDGSSAQIAFCKSISVEQAIKTRGALLWHPGHIAISLGNGRTIEAANPGFGVGSITAYGRFQRGGLIPGMRY